MLAIKKLLYESISGLLIACIYCQVSFAQVCSANGVQEIQSDLEAAKGQKAEVDAHLQKIQDMMRSIQSSSNTSQQTVDTLKQAESKDFDAIQKLNSRIDADQSCLKTPSCTEIVHVSNVSGQVVWVHDSVAMSLKSVCDLEPGDEIRTGNDGSADLIILGGKRTIHLSPNTDFKMPQGDLITHLLADPDSRFYGDSVRG